MTKALEGRTDNKMHNELSAWRFLELKWDALVLRKLFTGFNRVYSARKPFKNPPVDKPFPWGPSAAPAGALATRPLS